MAKAAKPKTPPKKRGKYDITVKTNLSADELLKKALTTSHKQKNKNGKY